MGRVPLRRVIRVMGLALAALLLLLVIGTVTLLLVAQGPRFGWLATRLMPDTAGDIALDGGHISLGAYSALLTGRRAPVHLQGLKVTDPEGTVVLSAAQVTADVELHLGPPSLVAHNLRVTDATWRLAQMKSRRGLGFTAAFAPATPVRVRRRPRAAAPGFLFQIADATLHNLDAAFDFPTWGLTLDDVEARGALLIDQREPGRPLFTFDAQDVDARGGGLLRILRDARALSLPFDRVAIRRVATTADRPQVIALSVTAATTGRSRLHGEATFTTAPRARRTGPRPGLDLDATIDSPADALTAAAARSPVAALRALTFSGGEGSLSLRLQGPYDALRTHVDALDLDLTYGQHTFRRLRLRGSGALRPLRIDPFMLSFSTPGGGRVNLDARLDPDRVLDADLRVRQLATASYLPAPLRPLFGGSLTGRVAARATLHTGDAAIRTLDLTLARSNGAPLPDILRLRGSDRAPTTKRRDRLTVSAPGVRFSDGALVVRRLSGPFLGGRLTLDGRIDFWEKTPDRRYASPKVALTIAAADIDLDQAGVRALVGGRAAFRASARGTFARTDLSVDLLPRSRLTLLGDRYAADGPLVARLEQGALSFPSLRLNQVPYGGAGAIAIRGEIGPANVSVSLSVASHRLTALPGLGGAGLPLGGLIDAELQLRGPPAAPKLAGRATLRQVVLHGAALGDGFVTLTPAGRRAAHVAGVLFSHFQIDGVIADDARGPSIVLGIDLRRAPLDGLLPSSLNLLTAGRGSATGRVTMNLVAGQPAAFTAAFDELSLSYAVRGRTALAGERGRLTVRSTGPARARMRGWGDQLVVEEAALDLGAGPVHVAGRLESGRLGVDVAGPLDLALLQPLVNALTGDALARLTGVVRGDLKLVGTLNAPIVQGDLAVVRSVEIVLAQAPGSRLRVVEGRLSLAATTLRFHAVTVSVNHEAPPPATSFSGTLRADGRITGLLPGSPPIISARAQLRDAQIKLPSLRETLLIPSASIVGDGRVLTVASLQATVGGGTITIGGDARRSPATFSIASLFPFALGAIDVPVVGRGIDWSPVGGLDVDQLDFDLRLEGDVRKSLVLKGEARLAAGQYRVDVKPPPAIKRPSGVRPPTPTKRRPTLMDRTYLDVRLRALGDRFVIKKRGLPALHLDLALHARGPVSSPQIEAEAKAKDLYGMLALMLYRLIR